MTDIVERLRVHPSDNGGPSWSEMLLERADAASEIERLRAGGCARDQTTTQFCAEVYAAVAAEREACAKIAEPPKSEPSTPEARLARTVREIIAAAIRARRP